MGVLDWRPEWAQTPGTDTASMVLKAERSGHVAGLKEALEIARAKHQKWDGGSYGPPTVGLDDSIDAIESRIRELEKDNG